MDGTVQSPNTFLGRMPEQEMNAWNNSSFTKANPGHCARNQKAPNPNEVAALQINTKPFNVNKLKRYGGFSIKETEQKQIRTRTKNT